MIIIKNKSIFNWLLSNFILLLANVFLVACEKSSLMEVNLHGVNYSDQEFSYHVTDPLSKNESGGGREIIDRFAAGGTTCCITLPKKWRPEIKLKVDITYWLKTSPDGKPLEIREKHIIEVPRYANDAPGELWVLRGGDGEIDVVSSDFQPDHPQWPGKLKGWPVPSLAYRQERWKIIFEHEEGGVRDTIHLLNELENNPRIRAKEAWEHAKEYEPSTITGFSGPDDPKYIAWLKKDYEDALAYSRSRVKQVMEEKP